MAVAVHVGLRVDRLPRAFQQHYGREAFVHVQAQIKEFFWGTFDGKLLFLILGFFS